MRVLSVLVMENASVQIIVLVKKGTSLISATLQDRVESLTLKIYECALSMEIALHKMFADVNQDMLESCVNTQFVSESNQTTKQSAAVSEIVLSLMYVHVNMDTVGLIAILFKHVMDMNSPI